MAPKLSITDHNRDIAGLKYVYPVISRRAGGISIGINFNTNNACNWQCVYCQVPNLVIGNAPALDFALLEEELRFFLGEVANGNFYQQFDIAENLRHIKDIAISGNGEPTSLKTFPEAVELIGEIATKMGVFPSCKFVLITNGSLVHLPKVRLGLQVLNKFGGEVWFKLDSATAEGRAQLNNCAQTVQSCLKNLGLSASLCRTRLQICLFHYGELGFSSHEQQALISFLQTIKQETQINSALLYTIAREPLQPAPHKPIKLSNEELNSFANKIMGLGYDVVVSS